MDMSVVPFEYRPAGWNSSMSSAEYRSHIEAEFIRLSFNPLESRGFFTESWKSLRAIELVFNEPANYLSEVRRADLRGSSQGIELETFFHLNQLGNFVMVWRPNARAKAIYEQRGDMDQATPWRRPTNELLHINDLIALKLPLTDLPSNEGREHPSSDVFLVSDLLCLIRALTNEANELVGSRYSVSPQSGFDFTIEEQLLTKASPDAISLVTNWNIIQYGPLG